MTQMMQPLRSRLARFWRGDEGAVTLEFVLVMPFLFWAFMATYVFFDGYRQSTVNLKAAYTIGDLISRETDAINDDYIDSMHELLQLMAPGRTATRLRVTIVRWDEEDDRYYVDWSAARGFTQARDNDTILGVTRRLPVMPDNERVILIETRNVFVPPFKVGLDTMKLDSIIFTRPRYAPQVVWRDA